MIGHLDEPLTNSTIYSSDIVCRGWAYSEEGITSIKIVIDGDEVGDAEYGLLRNDVKNAIPDYPNIEKSGFIFSKKIPLNIGLHQMKVKVYEKNGTLADLGEVVFHVSKKNIFSNKFSLGKFRIFNKKNIKNNLLESRKRVSFRYLDGNGVEIGALHNPLPVSGDAIVKYVDRFSFSELQKHYSDLDPQQMVKIDIIDDGEILSTIEDNSLDFIIANHFLEHCENPIGTIRNHLKKIKPGGILYYAIPEKNFTFDKNRTLTTFNHLVYDDADSPIISRKDHFYEWVTIVEDNSDTDSINSRVSGLMAMNYSIHYHVWDVETIFRFLDKTNDYLNNLFKVLHFEKNESEIIIVLQKKVLDK
jgi:SAM-dependent methyltransferase